MKNTKITAILMILIVASLMLISGCGKKTTVKYIAPTGYTILEAKASRPAQQPVQIEIKETVPKNGSSAAPNQTVHAANSSTLIDNITFAQPTSPVIGSYTPYEADVAEVKPKICSINEVILGYVGCYYNQDKTAARVTLKDTGRGDIDQMWFYLVLADQTVYMKSEGFTVGNMNDYYLTLSDWSKKYNRKILRILITPVVKEGNFLFICNNRQLLLIPEENCRETVD